MSISKYPKIRFKDENGNDYPDWEEKKLGEMFEIKKGIQISKKNLSLNGQKCILYGELFTRYDEIIEDVTSKTDLDVLPNSKYYDILMPSSDVTPNGLAKASCLLENDVILGGDMNILRYKDENVFPPFFSYQINYFKKKIMDVVSGTTIKHVYSKNIEKLNYEVPLCIDEQEKIASFFMLLDKRIEQQEQKIALLKDYKKAMMQKIFSQKIRFKDENGNDYPDWEEKKLGEVCNITTGKLDANAMSPGGKYRFYTCAKEFYNIDYFAFDTEALLISGNGANVGYIHYYNGKFNAYQRTYVLDNFSQNTLFIKYFLDEFLYKRINSEKKDGNTPYIVIGVLLEMKLLFPILSEQEKISILLFKIDNNIEKQEIILEKLKSKKKSLLYNMFM